MALHNQVGKDGEKLAEKFLLEKGYEIIHKNWRYSYYEIDIIAKHGNILHIVEVKTLNEIEGFFPEDAVTKEKFRKLQIATDEFLYRNPGYRHIQYDIIAITIRETQEPEIFLLADVYL